MSAGAYTTTVDILGGADTKNEWGDPVEGSQLLLADVPASLVERPVRVATESSSTPVTIHFFTGRLPHGTPVTQNDRLRDQADGLVYQVDYVSRPANPVMPEDVRLDLRRVT